MCLDAVAAIARLAIAAAQAEFELQEALEEERRFSPNLVAKVEEVLTRRADTMALGVLRWATGKPNAKEGEPLYTLALSTALPDEDRHKIEVLLMELMELREAARPADLEKARALVESAGDTQ